MLHMMVGDNISEEQVRYGLGCSQQGFLDVFGLGLTSQSTIFQSCLDRANDFLGTTSTMGSKCVLLKDTMRERYVLGPRTLDLESSSYHWVTRLLASK